MLPDPVGHHARRERMARDCFRQFDPPASHLERDRFPFAQDGDEPPGRFIAQVIGASTKINLNVVRLGRLA